MFCFLADTSQTNEVQRFSPCSCESTTSMTKGDGLHKLRFNGVDACEYMVTSTHLQWCKISSVKPKPAVRTILTMKIHRPIGTWIFLVWVDEAILRVSWEQVTCLKYKFMVAETEAQQFPLPALLCEQYWPLGHFGPQVGSSWLKLAQVGSKLILFFTFWATCNTKKL